MRRPALLVALVALTWSFVRDIAWLYRADRVREAARERWSSREPALAG